jgi:hypothetical protein
MNNNFIKNILSDLKVELTDEFDKNFERKAFFDKPWPEVTIPNKRGSLMARTGTLRRSVRSRVTAGELHFYSSSPYALIQNEGGTIVVTAKMKKYFWYRYYELVGKVTYNVKTKSANYNSRTQKLTAEARYWRAMALKPVGSKVTIRARRFIGHHRQVDFIVQRVVHDNLKEIATFIKNSFKR